MVYYIFDMALMEVFHPELIHTQEDSKVGMGCLIQDFEIDDAQIMSCSNLGQKASEHFYIHGTGLALRLVTPMPTVKRSFKYT